MSHPSLPRARRNKNICIGIVSYPTTIADWITSAIGLLRIIFNECKLPMTSEENPALSRRTNRFETVATYLSTGGTERSVRRHGDSVDVARVTVVVRLQLAVGQVPHLHRTAPFTMTTALTSSVMVVTHSQEGSTPTQNSAFHNDDCFDIVSNGGDTQSRNLHQIFVQVHASSADDTSNKNGRSWTKQITFSILSVNHSIGTQNFYLNNLNKFT